MQVIDFIKEIGFDIISFPDGEKHLRINELDRKDTASIICRIKSSDDLFLLMQLSDILNRQCVVVENIDIHYLMTMRNDRVISFNQPFSLKIVADVINSFNAKIVNIIEPHSIASLNLIKNSKSITFNFASDYNFTICHPDKGAYYRLGKSGDLQCSKVRDLENGYLLSFNIDNPQEFIGGGIIVVDDLCDGGGTFCGIAPKLRALEPSELYLCITHSIQKLGIEKVAKLYDKVIITNSYKDWQYEDLPSNVEVKIIS